MRFPGDKLRLIPAFAGTAFCSNFCLLYDETAKLANFFELSKILIEPVTEFFCGLKVKFGTYH
ncbi:Uncharacterised protein [Legionella israelensis]|uniref:Uncharacterized protein n=1 Tax=Legionella israelensis TaxID=454 RepID=A0A0W0WBY3_9GAMM|nr:hypothetical protein Lisr_0807 [Legionella israelensis]SCY02734.1 hypothetical protein SAMN02746069_01034 [Legionella israelensis DSM 19235]STX58558.1 Uncharacterised protein [Legionella israelensis]